MQNKVGLCLSCSCIRVFRLQTKLLFDVDSNVERYLSFGEVVWTCCSNSWWVGARADR